MNVQLIADPAGLWASPALPGSVHDIKAARTHGIIGALAGAGVDCRADKGYRGAAGTVRVPHWGRRETLSPGQRAVNCSHAKIRVLVEQAMATLKTWRLMRKLRCSTSRITSPVQAVLTLHLTCTNRGGKRLSASKRRPRPRPRQNRLRATISKSSRPDQGSGRDDLLGVRPPRDHPYGCGVRAPHHQAERERGPDCHHLTAFGARGPSAGRPSPGRGPCGCARRRRSVRRGRGRAFRVLPRSSGRRRPVARRSGTGAFRWPRS